MILVQREFHVAREDQAEFERQSREGLWPTFLHFGAQMVGFGRWGFGGQGGVVVTNTVYADFEHWLATRMLIGDFYKDEAMMEETKDLRPIFANRNDLISKTEAHLFEIEDDHSEPETFYRRVGADLASAPATFGRGSVICIRRYAIVRGSFRDFVDMTAAEVAPGLKERGARLLVIGRDLMTGPDNAVVFTAYPSLPVFYADAGDDAVRSAARDMLTTSEQGQLLMVATDFGQKT